MLFRLLSFSLICLTCVTTSICLSPLSIICKNNSVIHSSGKTLKWRLSPALSQLIDFIGRVVYQKQYSQSTIQIKQWEQMSKSTDASYAVYFCTSAREKMCLRVPACCIGTSILVTLSTVCVCPSQYLSFCRPCSRTK